MRWCLVRKDGAAAPATGDYRCWKPHLAREGQYQCVYCALPDNRFGGEYNFHVEHFEPKSKAPLRTNEWANLYYACAICNVFKGSDWPTPGSQTAYIDPSKTDYSGVFTIDVDGRVSGATSNARYMIERLYLNRPQLILARREAMLLDRFRAVEQRLDSTCDMLKEPMFDAGTALESLREVRAAERRISRILEQLRNTRLYTTEDVRRGK